MSANIKQCFILSFSLRSRRKKEQACERETRVCPSRALVLSCAHYFQTPATRAASASFIPIKLYFRCSKETMTDILWSSTSLPVRSMVDTSGFILCLGILISAWDLNSMDACTVRDHLQVRLYRKCQLFSWYYCIVTALILNVADWGIQICTKQGEGEGGAYIGP